MFLCVKAFYYYFFLYLIQVFVFKYRIEVMVDIKCEGIITFNNHVRDLDRQDEFSLYLLISTLIKRLSLLLKGKKGYSFL